tara:strand:- start:3023 stop:3274 length:252 start_codon:yes stop_codon:yes gene_type:complete
MLTPKDFLGIKKKFEIDDTVLLIIKEYPVFCRVLDTQEHLTEGFIYKLDVLDEEVKKEILKQSGKEEAYLWMPLQYINAVKQA